MHCHGNVLREISNLWWISLQYINLSWILLMHTVKKGINFRPFIASVLRLIGSWSVRWSPLSHCFVTERKLPDKNPNRVRPIISGFIDQTHLVEGKFSFVASLWAYLEMLTANLCHLKLLLRHSQMPTMIFSHSPSRTDRLSARYEGTDWTPIIGPYTNNHRWRDFLLYLCRYREWNLKILIGWSKGLHLQSNNKACRFPFERARYVLNDV
jgi:hypothetical protein